MFGRAIPVALLLVRYVYFFDFVLESVFFLIFFVFFCTFFLGFFKGRISKKYLSNNL